MRNAVLAFALLAAAPLGAAETVPAGLDSYVRAPDPSFAWKVERTVDLPGGRASVAVVRLTSQTWHGIRWEHWLYVMHPEKVAHPESALLVIAGGSNRKDPPQKLPNEAAILAPISLGTGTVIAVLGQVPNQPLLGNLKEDGLIAETFKRFYETDDATWPCLLPMTKAAVRAMDAVQALVKEKFAQEVTRFVVTGASKRGWTTWLAGSADGRVAAIAPMVIDMLNLPEQMPLQVRSFGGYSEQIADYTRLGLQDKLKDPSGGSRLLDLVDPYRRRAKLARPKLIVLGTNDRYWPVDAVKMYFGDLPGEKHIHYVPNAGHGLGPGAVEAIAAFYADVVDGKERPRFSWTVRDDGVARVLTIETKDAPEKAELWTAAAPTRDFRDARWSARPLEKSAGGAFEASVPEPATGFSAFFGSLTYKSPLGPAYTLDTNVEVLGDRRAAAAEKR